MRLINVDALPREKMLAARGNGQYEDVDIVYGDDIDNAPTIDPVRHGYWKETDDPMFRACSVCGYLEYECNEGNYCPECGALMDVGEE